LLCFSRILSIVCGAQAELEKLQKEQEQSTRRLLELEELLAAMAGMMP
jgi:hypothetical protein